MGCRPSSHKYVDMESDSCDCGAMCVGADGSRKRLPITGVAVAATTANCLATVEVTQTYQNTSKAALEQCCFTFPLDAAAVLNAVRITIGDKVIEGKVREREAAKKAYSEAVARGTTAVLVGQVSVTSRDVFQTDIGAVAPGQTVNVELTYVTELRYVRGGALEFVLPTTLAPRYGGVCPETKGGYVLDVTVRVNAASAVTACMCCTHSDVSVALGDGDDATKAVVHYGSNDGKGLAGDFVVRIEQSQLCQPYAWVESGADGTVAVCAALFPSLEHVTCVDGTAPRFVFMADCSGSMAGWKMQALQRALTLCIKSLPVVCVFQVVSFSHSFDELFPDGPVVYSDETAARAVEAIAGYRAAGGTEILKALRKVFATADVNSNAPVQVFVFTDGEVVRTTEVVDCCRQQHKNTGARVFTFGIGKEVSVELVEGAANAAGGTATFIRGPDDDMAEAVIGQLENACQLPVVNVVVDWGVFAPYLEFPAAPAVCKPLYVGSRVLTYGVLSTGTPVREGDIVIRADTPSGPQAWRLHVVLGTPTSVGRTVLTCAARAHIVDLEDAARENDAVALAVK